MSAEPVLFNKTRYPRLLKVIDSNHYGRMELIEVNATIDGYLQGLAIIGKGKGAYMHSVFLGRITDFK